MTVRPDPSEILRKKLLAMHAATPAAKGLKIVTTGRFPIRKDPRNPTLQARPERLPAFIDSELAAAWLRYLTADIRKMWPALCREFNLSGERPRGDTIPAFLLERIATPFGGRAFFECALEAKVAVPIQRLDRTATGIVAAEYVTSEISRSQSADMIGMGLFMNAWIFGELPDPAHYEEIHRVAYGLEAQQIPILSTPNPSRLPALDASNSLNQMFQYLDWLRTLDPTEQVVSTTPPAREEHTDEPVGVQVDSASLFTSLAEKLRETLATATADSDPQVFTVMAEAVGHLREVAAFRKLQVQMLRPEDVGPLLASVHASISISNKATQPQYSIVPLPIDAIQAGAPYLTTSFHVALDAAVRAGDALPRFIDELAAAKTAFSADCGMGSDEDLAKMSGARTALREAAITFATEVDAVRRFLEDGVAQPTPATHEVPEARRGKIIEALGFANDFPLIKKGTPAASNHWVMPTAGPVAAAPKAPEPFLPPAAEQPAPSIETPSGHASAPRERPSPMLEAAPATVRPLVAKAQSVVVEPVSAKHVGRAEVAGTTLDDDKTLQSLTQLMLNGNPGSALALARIHEETLLEELSGGPAFYALIAGAAATCGVETPRYDGLDRHFDVVMQRLQSSSDDGMAQAYAMAYLAAVIKPALFTANAMAAYNIHLLPNCLGTPALESFAALIEEPIHTSLQVSLEALRDALGKGEDARNSSLKQARVRARGIIDNVDGSTRHDFNSHLPSQQTWRFIRSANHPVGAALAALANQEIGSPLQTPLKAAAGLFEDGVDDIVDEAFSKFASDRLVAANRVRLTTAIERIGEFLEQAERLVNPPPARRAEEAARLANYTGRLVSGIASSIEALKSISCSGAHEVARGVLELVLRDLQGLITGTAGGRLIMGIDERLHRDLALQDIELGVEINGSSNEGKTLYAVGREVVLHGDRNDLLNTLRAAEPTALTDEAFIRAARAHIDARRILSANAAITALRAQSPDHADLADLTVEYEAARTKARLGLRDHVVAARKVLSRAAFSLQLPPSDVARKDAALERTLELSNNLPIEGAVGGPLQNDRPTDFTTARDFLDVAIVEPLLNIQRKALKAFEEKVASDRATVAEERQGDVDKLLQLARDGQIVPAEDFFSQLLSGQGLPRLETGNSVLREFHEVYVPAVARQDKSPIAEEPRLPKDDQTLRKQILDSWVQVTQLGQTGAARTLVAFLSALARTDVGSVGSPKIHNTVAIHEVSNLDFSLSVGTDAFVLPVIGSISKARFRVAVVHGAGTLTHIREALQQDPNILLTRTKLTIEDRRKLYADIRQAGRGCLIIDEHLVQYAARVPTSAAARVIAVASSFLYTGPYRIEDATSPEMYFGRRTARRQILETRTGLIFGGRRLGKSSIIADICRKETSAPQKKFYLHVELNQHMVAENYEDEVWRIIAQALRTHGVASSPNIQFTNGNPKFVLDTLKKAFLDDRITHLTLYLDEADRFMQLEEESNFKVLYEFTTELTHRFPDRFSYAISGLNNVQRVSLGWNTRLGRFSDAIAITPFIDQDRHEGLRLIVEPLAALGFEFESADLPLQIMSAASFYPALIQGYCSKLLETLYQKPVSGVAPFKITQNDLSTTEANEDLRLKFLNIFKLTVLLDERYMAVCAILAEEQGYRDGADVSMLLSAISERAVQVAPGLFPKSDPTTIVEAACEALINLGLLVRQPHTQLYQFRSPRILSKVREISQVTDFLKSGGKTHIFATRDPSQNRPLFADGSVCPLPERLINTICAPSMPGESSRFITASEASGLTRLRKLGTDPSWTNGRVVPRTGLADSENLMREFVTQVSKTRVAQKQKLTLQLPAQSRELYVVGGNWHANTPSRIASVDATLQSEHRSVLLICDPERAWDLSSQPGTRMSYLPPWTPAALKHHLQRLEMPDQTSDDALRQILDVTGGCTSLVDACCAWLSQKGQMPGTLDLLKALNVTDIKSVYSFFGLRQDHERILNDMPSRPDSRQALEQFFRDKGIVSDATRLLTYMEWMGALQVDEQGHWGLNPVLTTALLEVS